LNGAYEVAPLAAAVLVDQSGGLGQLAALKNLEKIGFLSPKDMPLPSVRAPWLLGPWGPRQPFFARLQMHDRWRDGGGLSDLDRRMCVLTLEGPKPFSKNNPMQSTFEQLLKYIIMHIV
jgi:hypothetical protein